MTREIDLCRLGLDTFEIAERVGLSEATVSRRIYEQRCHERNLPVQYERRVRDQSGRAA